MLTTLKRRSKAWHSFRIRELTRYCHTAGQGSPTSHKVDVMLIHLTKIIKKTPQSLVIFCREQWNVSKWAKLLCSSLIIAVAHLRKELATKAVTCTMTSNHRNAVISQTTEYELTRQVCSVAFGMNEGCRGWGKVHILRHSPQTSSTMPKLALLCF